MTFLGWLYVGLLGVGFLGVMSFALYHVAMVVWRGYGTPAGRFTPHHKDSLLNAEATPTPGDEEDG